jgi:hypothetical protein
MLDPLTTVHYPLTPSTANRPPARPPAVHVDQAGVVNASFILLWGAAVLAIWSLCAYFANVWTHFVMPVSKRSA